jgi:hypothetical protein
VLSSFQGDSGGPIVYTRYEEDNLYGWRRRAGDINAGKSKVGDINAGKSKLEDIDAAKWGTGDINADKRKVGDINAGKSILEELNSSRKGSAWEDNNDLLGLLLGELDLCHTQKYTHTPFYNKLGSNQNSLVGKTVSFRKHWSLESSTVNLENC